ncbi:DNA-binding protein [Planctomycetota bacterium]
MNTPLSSALAPLVTAFSLGTGETAALQLLLARTGGRKILLTDDLAARTAAGILGFEAHGTVGIIVRAIRVGLKTPREVVKILQDLPTRSTLHIRLTLLNEVIDEVRSEHRLE